MPAVQQVAQQVQQQTLPLTMINEVGAISLLGPGETAEAPKVFENVDGKRIEDGRYAAFAKDVSGAVTDGGGRPGSSRKSPPTYLSFHSLNVAVDLRWELSVLGSR